MTALVVHRAEPWRVLARCAGGIVVGPVVIRLARVR